MEWWQIILGVFIVLLPLVLMLDFWGDERLTARGEPIPRDWFRQIEHEEHEEHEEAASHDDTDDATGAAVDESAEDAETAEPASH